MCIRDRSHSRIQSRCMLRQHRERDRVCAMSAQCVRAMLSPSAAGCSTGKGREREGEREGARIPMPACLCAHAYAYARRVCMHGRLTFDSTERETECADEGRGGESEREREGERASVWSVSRDGGVPSEWVSQSRDRTGV